jgi:hypothetical protein
MSANQNVNEQNFYSEAVSNYKAQKLDKGSIVNEFQKVGELSAAYPRNLLSPRYIFPDTLLENVANRYKI